MSSLKGMTSVFLKITDVIASSDDIRRFFTNLQKRHYRFQLIAPGALDEYRVSLKRLLL